MPDPPKKKKRWFLRAVWGLITLIGVSGVIAILDYREKQKDREQDRREQAEQRFEEQQKELKKQLTSSVWGHVYDRQTQKSLGNIWVGCRTHEGFEHLATTTNEGHFKLNVQIFDEDVFPIRIELTSPDWHGGIFQTNEYIEYSKKRRGVNIYVNTGVFP